VGGLAGWGLLVALLGPHVQLLEQGLALLMRQPHELLLELLEFWVVGY